jgi:hypothetical protein
VAEGAEIVGRKPARAPQRIRAFVVVFRHGHTCSTNPIPVIPQAIHVEQAPRGSIAGFL